MPTDPPAPVLAAPPARDRLREAAQTVLLRMPLRPQPDENGQYEAVWLSVSAPIWEALDALRAALDAETAPDPAGRAVVVAPEERARLSGSGRGPGDL
jgi:hypothetical protein